MVPTTMLDEVNPDKIITPLDTLAELFSFKRPPLCAVQPLRNIKRGRPEDPKTLLRHDLMGGYQEDRFIHGCAKPMGYQFHHWQVIDSFVYYSHHMVTIPPPGWISAAHRHGVKVLGTFIIESDEGTEVLDTIRRDNLLSKVASQLALIAALSRFDGWFIDIESEMEKCHVGFLKELLLAITTETHRSVPESLVIWYDSVVHDGTLDWQNELNERNCDFFNLCDGIFLNSHWTEDMLQQSASFAEDRKSDVYVGIDVYARKTSYRAGFNTYEVVETARKLGLSAAIFGAGWTYEAQDKRRFIPNQCRLWSFPDHCCPEWRLRAPPISTTFCQGFGDSLYKKGQVVSRQPWFDLSKQQLQPRDQNTWLYKGCGSAHIYTEDAYSGGGCLRLRFLPDPEQPEAVPYFRLFGCDFPLGRLTVSYTFKQQKPCSTMENDIVLVLKARTAAGEREELLLGVTVTMPDEECYAVVHDMSLSSPDVSGNSWITRKYNIEDLRTVDYAILEEIGFSFVSPQANICLLGELVVDRLEKMSSNQAAATGNDGNEASNDSGPDVAMCSDEDDSEEPEKQPLQAENSTTS